MRLLLVRHGESICAVNGVVGGAIGCTGLTDRGGAQARALGERLAAEGFRADVLYASTLPRAAQTAEAVGDALSLPIVPDDELRELVPGEIDGSAWSDYVGFSMVDEPERPVSPGGESLRGFQGRVRTTLDRMAREHDGQTVVAVCHGGIVLTSMYVNLGLADGTFTGDIDYTSITEWRVDAGVWTLVRFNDVAHLMSSDLLVS
jgi:probable phosphoglycerate mutase